MIIVIFLPVASVRKSSTNSWHTESWAGLVNPCHPHHCNDNLRLYIIELMRCVHKGSFGNGPIRRNSASSKGLAPPHGCTDANTNTQANTNTYTYMYICIYTHTSGPIRRNGSSSRGLAAPPMATIAKAHCSLQSGVYFECSEQIMQKLYLTLFIFSWV